MIEPTDVRLAVSEDRASIFALCKELEAENALVPMNVDKVFAKLDEAFKRQGGIIGVIGPIGDAHAMIALELSQPWYSDEWVLAELFNYVTAAHRRSTYAKQLIAYAKKTSTQLKIPLVIGILSTKRTEAKMRFYERQLTRAGAFYLFNGETGKHT